MVGAGIGVSVVPEMAIEKNRAAVSCGSRMPPPRTIGAVILYGRSLSRAHHAFFAHLRDAI
jgi:DNA-binding transcriptional LysR family regulator